MPDKITVAGVQMDVAIGDTRANLDRIVYFARQAHALGAQIVVFPELALSGYCFNDLAEAAAVAEPVPGPSTAELKNVCRELDILILVGLLEKVF